MLPLLIKKEFGLEDWVEDVNDLFYSGWKQPKLYSSVPKVDIYKDENHYVIEAELPGFSKEEVSIQTEDNTLTLSGSKKSQDNSSDNYYYRRERQPGDFKRHFSFNNDVDFSKSEASFDNGVLSLKVPKKEEAKPKQIEISIT